MDVVKKCEDVWLSATSEREKLAAVQVMIKLSKSSHLTNVQRKEIFDNIGFGYLYRLIKTEIAPRGCTPTICKSVAISVLSYYSSDPEIAVSEALCGMTAEFKTILNSDFIHPSAESLVADTLDCIYNMAKCYKSRKNLLQNGIISCLIKSYVIDPYKSEKSLQILKMLLNYYKGESSEGDSAVFEFPLLQLAKEFNTRGSDEDSIHASVLSILCDPQGKIQGDEPWALELQESLAKILRSKTSNDLKDVALKLAGLLIEKCGAVWLGDDTKTNKFFFMVLVHSVCVEVQHLVYGRTLEDILKDTFLLNACYSILECMMLTMTEDNLWHPLQPYLKQLKTSVKAASKSSLDFLSMISPEWNSLHDSNELSIRELVYVSIRVFCTWLNEETSGVQDEACKIVPFVFTVCCECFRLFQSTALHSNSQTCHIDLLQFLWPPLDRLILDDDLRNVLLGHELLDVTFHYFFYHWPVFLKEPSLENDTLLCNVCKIVLTIVCMNTKLVSESEVFFSFLKYLLNIVTLLPSDNGNLCLKANFSALGLLITKQHYKRIKSCETSFYRFLSFSIKFLWDSHHVEDGNDSVAFVLIREYRHYWSDIMEPWFLGMHALSSLLPLMPWITDFLMESGWPQHIIASLTRVGEKSIEGSVKYAYQAFLSALVRVSKDAARTLYDCEAIYVCKKHKLKELEALLLDYKALQVLRSALDVPY